MKSTFNLFLVSGSIVVLTFLVATFWTAIGLGDNKSPLALTLTLAFGVSIAGLIVGMPELKRSKKPKTIIGLIGHAVVLTFFLATASYAVFTM